MNLLLSLPLAQGGFPFLFFVLDWLQKLQWFQCEPILVSGVALRYLWLYSSGQEGLIFLWVLSNLEFTLSVTNRLILDLGKSEVFSQFIDTQYFGIKPWCEDSLQCVLGLEKRYVCRPAHTHMSNTHTHAHNKYISMHTYI